MRWLAVWREIYSFSSPQVRTVQLQLHLLNDFNAVPAPAKGAPLSADNQAELDARHAEQLAVKVAKAEKIDLLADTLLVTNGGGLATTLHFSNLMSWIQFVKPIFKLMSWIQFVNSQKNKLSSMMKNWRKLTSEL